MPPERNASTYRTLSSHEATVGRFPVAALMTSSPKAPAAGDKLAQLLMDATQGVAVLPIHCAFS